MGHNLDTYRNRTIDLRMYPLRRNDASASDRTSPHSLRGIDTTRSLTFSPKIVKRATRIPSKSWLEQALPYSVVAMKMFGSTINTGKRVYVDSMTQGILIGIDDIIYDHPITKPKTLTINNKQEEVMAIKYSVGRLKHLNIVLSLSGPFQNRAGRMVCVLQPLIREKALLLQHRDLSSLIDETKTFTQLSQMPGAITSSNLRPITISVTPRGFPASWTEVGQAEPSSAFVKYPNGGMPLYQLMIGYQDLAANFPTPSLAYSIHRASFNVEVNGIIELKSPTSSDRVMRSKVISIQNANNLSILRSGSRGRTEVPLSQIEYRDGLLHLDEVEEDGFVLV